MGAHHHGLGAAAAWPSGYSVRFPKQWSWVRIPVGLLFLGQIGFFLSGGSLLDLLIGDITGHFHRSKRSILGAEQHIRAADARIAPRGRKLVPRFSPRPSKITGNTPGIFSSGDDDESNSLVALSVPGKRTQWTPGRHLWIQGPLPPDPTESRAAEAAI